MASSFGGTVKLTGESEYRKALSQITQNLKNVSSEIKLVASSFDKNDTSIQATTAKQRVLNKQLAEQSEKLNILKNKYSDMVSQYGKNSTKQQELIKNIEDEKRKLQEIEATLGKSSKEYLEQVKVVDKLEKTQVEYNNAISNAKIEINNAQTAINKTKNEISKLDKETNKSANNLQDMKQGFDDAGSGALKFGDLVKANVIGDVIVGGLRAVGTAVKEIASKMGELGKSVLDARGEMEQQVGGIETLFKNNSDTVIKNASNAYKTAGISATEYMQQATSFSASLLQSLNGDTKKVAEVTDMAIVDMSDNANKMGTEIGRIQDAYQGFAKQNYTMLDNLKLGYGGTKTEMQRLLEDAQKVTGIKYDINNLNDVYQAIHIIQGELGITGTTAKEATETLQGSMAGLQGAWQNFLNGSGSLSQVSDAAMTTVKNVTRIAKEAIPQILGDIKSSLPQLLEVGKETLTTIVDGIKQYLPELINMAIEIVNTLLNALVEQLPVILEAGVQAIVQLAQGLAQALPDLIPKAIDAIITIVEGLLDNIDQLIDAGIQMIMGLADGLMEALPKLIDKIPVIIDKLIDAIVNNLPKLLEAGIELIVKLAEGLIKAIPQLISKIPQIITSLVKGIFNLAFKLSEVGGNLFTKFKDGILKGIGSLKDVGKNLVQGLWNGINNAKDWILDKIKGFGESILNGIKGFFGIHSPSTVFRDEVGKFMAEGIGVGFENEMGNVATQMQSAIPTEFDVNSTLAQQSSEINLKEALIEAFKQFKPSVILNGKEIGEFAFEYSNVKYGNYYN